METERPDAIFHDPYARRLAGPEGEEIVRRMPKGRAMSWPMVVRTAIMDEILQREIAARRLDLVLNLAAGLDARPWRLDLPPALRWVDVDHEPMIAYKTGAMAGERIRCDYRTIAADLADPEARARTIATATAGAQRGLVITEGLLVYLHESDVAGLARDLHAASPLALWMTDLASPGLLAWSAKSWGKTLSAGNAPFRFGPADAVGFFGGLGWQEIEYRSQFQESLRLNRTFRFARFWSFVGRYLSSEKRKREMARFSGIALMERA